jgi:hypothetical protein
VDGLFCVGALRVELQMNPCLGLSLQRPPSFFTENVEEPATGLLKYSSIFIARALLHAQEDTSTSGVLLQMKSTERVFRSAPVLQ